MLKVDGYLGNLPVQFLLDSGATVSVIRYEILDCYYQQKITVSSTPAAVTANGSALEIVGQIIMPISITQFRSSQLFTVVRNLTVDCILGVDCLMQHGTVIDCKRCCATMGGVEFSFYAQPVQSSTRDCTLHLINDVVKVAQTIVIAGRTVQLLEVMLPPEITTLGVCNVLIEQQQSSNVPSHFLFPRTLSHVTSTGSAVIQVVNTGPSDVTLYKNTAIGHCTPAQNLLTIGIDSNTPSTSTQSSSSVFDLSSSDLSPSQQQDLQKLLSKYSDLFVGTEGQLGRTNMVKHSITTSEGPIRQPMHRLPVALKDTVDTQVQQMLHHNIIQPSCSPWSSPVVMVKKRMVHGVSVLITGN